MSASDSIYIFNTIESFFTSKFVKFIVYLEDYIINLIKDSEKSGHGTPAFNVRKYIPLYAFLPKELLAIIFLRIQYVGWKKTIFEFIEADAFWLLYSVSSGNPRMSFNILHDALEEASVNNSYVISSEHIKSVLKDQLITIDEIVISIFSYLYKNRESSASDDEFQSYVEIFFIKLL